MFRIFALLYLALDLSWVFLRRNILRFDQEFIQRYVKSGALSAV